MSKLYALTALVLIVLGSRSAVGQDLTNANLGGDWYVLVHYQDDRSEDDIEKFKDFAWAVKQQDTKIVWQFFPYVMFTEEQEMVRKQAMRDHKSWEPSPGMWNRIRKSVAVSPRGATKKTLRGDRAKGYESLPPMGGGGLNVITFTRDWNVTFAPEKVRVRIIDSLSGGGGLEGMEDSLIYEITEQVSADEFRGTYAEMHKKGTFRMVRTAREVR
jgi:hypothetical protein